MPSGRHSRPDRRPKPAAIALAAATATAIAVTPAAAGAATAEGAATTVKEAPATSTVKVTAKAAKASKASAKARAASAVSTRARKAVAYALAHRHDQYRWGGTGPHRFDCSGLTLAAWRQAGVKLPHRAKLQFRKGKHVAKSKLKPGDLVFFYTAKSHVGIYIGGGKMVHAANPRADIKVDSITRGYYAKKFVGATRIG
jgi:cell wall-associated NlpC family hydrolase